ASDVYKRQFWIIVRRLAQGHSPFTPDRGHLHHRLLDLGLSHRGAVLVIYAICALLAVLSFVLSGTGQLYAFLGMVVAGGMLLYFLTLRSQEALEASTYDETPGGNTADSGSAPAVEHAVRGTTGDTSDRADDDAPSR
ncbi:MAG: hypothetical protein QUU85_16600, partial [Candidatus Eisenbacteria bacterium]|nr:hypothetical protein [Candidatus Eisenbacteria bacterium]